MRKKIIDNAFEVENMLSEMEVSNKILMEAVQYADSERALCTDNDAVGFPSYLVYSRLGRRLREILCDGNGGWQKDNSNNQCAIVNPQKKLRIVPCNFNEFAGNPDMTPTNRTPKGEVSKRKTFRNRCNATEWLPSLPNPRFDKVIEIGDDYQTWILGVHITDEGLMGAELSYPISFDDGEFKDFHPRIILMQKGENTPPAGKRDNDDQYEIVDIEVKRKK